MLVRRARAAGEGAAPLEEQTALVIVFVKLAVQAEEAEVEGVRQLETRAILGTQVVPALLQLTIVFQ
jgi:hypothetical protein